MLCALLLLKPPRSAGFPPFVSIGPADLRSGICIDVRVAAPVETPKTNSQRNEHFFAALDRRGDKR